MKKLFLNHFSSIVFLLLLVGTSYFYQYHEIVFKRPQSIHKWRQSDCASIALNYYQSGMHFFSPEVHNLTSDNGTSGKCFTSEIPILYYSVAILYKIFGYHDYVYRIFNTLLFFLGLFFLFKLLFYLIKDVFWSISIALLFFTSPVLIYYGNNYLSNSSALAFSLIAWYYFIRFIFENKNKWFYISMICFFLAAAFKITALFSLLAIAGIYLLGLLKIKNIYPDEIVFLRSKKFIAPILLIIIVIIAWIKYANDYNTKHNCTYFSTTIFPIWNLKSADVKEVLLNIKNFWLNQYFHSSVLVFISICFLFILFNFKKNNQLLLYSILFIFVQAIVYILLQFWTFNDHDYYTIDLYILLILIVICACDLFRRNYSRFLNSILLKIFFTLFLIFNIYYAQSKIYERYNSWMNDYPENKGVYSITPYLRQIGINSNDTVIFIPDASHASLYLMNQKGWTEYKDARFNKGAAFYYNKDSAGIQASIDKGAKYLIVNGIDQLYQKPYLKTFCSYLIGEYNEILIFQLKNKKNNFSLQKKIIQQQLTCDAETTTQDKEFFINKTDSTLFQNGITKSSEFAHSGNFSSKLNSITPYGMTVKFNNLLYGETFTITAWRKINELTKSYIIASGDSYYNNEYTIVEKDSTGWEKIVKEFSIPKNLSSKEIVIYLYNPDKNSVYFDDLEIIRYKSAIIK